MSNRKKLDLVNKLGGHMTESAGGVHDSEDRYKGFIPSDVANGEMAIDRIMEDEEQPRKTYDEQSLRDFAEHLKSHGVQQAIQLRWSDKDQKWLIVYGHRRYRAAKLAGFKTIPCTFSSEDVDESTIRVRQLVENCQRQDLAAMEMARAIASLAEITGWSHRRMGQELGFNHATIGRYLDLLKLPEDLQERVDRGELAPSVAVDVLRLKSVAQRRAVGIEIAEQKLNRAKAKQRIDDALDLTTSNSGKSRTPAPHELLIQTANVTVYRRPDAADSDIRSELLKVIEQLTV